MQLIKYDAARKALQIASTIDEVKDIKDKAAALQAYARQKNDTDMEVWVAELKLRAVRKIGEISAKLEKAQRGGKGGTVKSAPGALLKKTALTNAGITKEDASRCERIANIPEKEFEQHIEEKRKKHQPVTAKEALTKVPQSRHRKEKIDNIIKNNKPLNTSERFNVIYADPPWQYKYSKSDSRKIENQYPTMALKEIENLKIPSADDCVLFLWATSPKLLEALTVMQSWGFEYRTCAVWDKKKIGMGYYYRQQHELLLIGIKGKIPTPKPANRPASVITVSRSHHSAKPSIVYEQIEAMYPEYEKLELFCRKKRKGWKVWGNQS